MANHRKDPNDDEAYRAQWGPFRSPEPDDRGMVVYEEVPYTQDQLRELPEPDIYDAVAEFREKEAATRRSDLAYLANRSKPGPCPGCGGDNCIQWINSGEAQAEAFRTAAEADLRTDIYTAARESIQEDNGRVPWTITNKVMHILKTKGLVP